MLLQEMMMMGRRRRRRSRRRRTVMMQFNSRLASTCSYPNSAFHPFGVGK